MDGLVTCFHIGGRIGINLGFGNDYVNVIFRDIQPIQGLGNILFVCHVGIRNKARDKQAPAAGWMLVLVPRSCVGLHEDGTPCKIPSGESIGDALGDFLHRFLVGEFLDKGVSVHNLFGNGAGQFLGINGLFPPSVAKNLAFGEQDDIIHERIFGDA